MQNLKPLASLYSWAGQLVANPEDRFSHDVAHMLCGMQFSLYQLQFQVSIRQEMKQSVKH